MNWLFHKAEVEDAQVVTIPEVKGSVGTYTLSTLKLGDTLSWTIDLYGDDAQQRMRFRFVVEVV